MIHEKSALLLLLCCGCHYGIFRVAADTELLHQMKEAEETNLESGDLVVHHFGEGDKYEDAKDLYLPASSLRGKGSLVRSGKTKWKKSMDLVGELLGTTDAGAIPISEFYTKQKPLDSDSSLNSNEERLFLPDGCVVPNPNWIRDGYCDKAGNYNTAECDWDGGDCCPETCVTGLKYSCGHYGFDCKSASSNLIIYKVDAHGYPVFDESGEYETTDSQLPTSEVVDDISTSVFQVTTVSDISGAIASNFIGFKNLGATLSLVGPVLNLALSSFGVSGSNAVINTIKNEFSKVNDKLGLLSNQVSDGFNEMKEMITIGNLNNYKDVLQRIGSKYIDLLAAQKDGGIREQLFREACNDVTPFDIFRDLYEHACDHCNAVQASTKQPFATHALYQMQQVSDYKIGKFTDSLGSYIISGLTEAMFLHSVCLPPINANGKYMVSFHNDNVWKSHLDQMKNGIIEVANELRKVKDEFHENWPSKRTWQDIKWNDDNRLTAVNTKNEISLNWDPEYYYEVVVYNTPVPSWPKSATDYAYYTGGANKGGNTASYLHISHGGKEIHIRYRSKILPKKDVGNFYNDFKAHKVGRCQETVCCGEFFWTCVCWSVWAACAEADWYYTAMIEQWNRSYYDKIGTGEGVLIVSFGHGLRSTADPGAFWATNDFNNDPAPDFTVFY